MSIVRFAPFAVDIAENDKDQLVLKAALPDLKREDISVQVESDTLTITGERKYEVSRAFSLPSTVDATRISAEYKDGILTVTLPYREEAKPRSINVEVAA